MIVRIFSIVLAVLWALPAVSAAERLTVVELFTSQGCGNCPPANRLVADLADRDGLLALTWSVNYWDYLGWQDTFARQHHADRQRAYNARLGVPGVYTPQIVVDGHMEAVGSHPGEVKRRIRQAERTPRPHYYIDIKRDGAICIVRLPAADPDAAIRVHAIWYSGSRTVAIRGGENAGKRVEYANVVMGDRMLRRWQGAAGSIEVHMNDPQSQGADHLAILLEREDSGLIVGAARISLTGAH